MRDVINSSDEFQGLVSLVAANSSDILGDVSAISFGKNIGSASLGYGDGGVGIDGLRNLRSTVATLIGDSSVRGQKINGDEEDWYAAL